MAFVNEKLTDEQREEFKKRGIKNPVNYNSVIISPIFWTVDYSRKIFFSQIVSGHRDYPHEYVFAVSIDDENIFVQLHGEKCSVWTWSIPDEKNYIIGNHFPFSKRENFLDVLREALQVYKILGTPDDENNNVDINVEI